MGVYLATTNYKKLLTIPDSQILNYRKKHFDKISVPANRTACADCHPLPLCSRYA